MNKTILYTTMCSIEAKELFSFQRKLKDFSQQGTRGVNKGATWYIEDADQGTSVHDRKVSTTSRFNSKFQQVFSPFNIYIINSQQDLSLADAVDQAREHPKVLQMPVFACKDV